jgi:hypothetical protein
MRATGSGGVSMPSRRRGDPFPGAKEIERYLDRAQVMMT